MNKEGGGFPPERVKGNGNNVSGVFKSDQTKPLRYSHDSFVKELIGKKIRISLTTNEVFEGILKEVGMYDVQLAINIPEKIVVSGKEMVKETTKFRIFFKSSIVWIEVV